MSHEKKFPKNAHDAMITGVTYWKSIEFKPNIPINTIKAIPTIWVLGAGVANNRPKNQLNYMVSVKDVV